MRFLLRWATPEKGFSFFCRPSINPNHIRRTLRRGHRFLTNDCIGSWGKVNIKTVRPFSVLNFYTYNFVGRIDILQNCTCFLSVAVLHVQQTVRLFLCIEIYTYNFSIGSMYFQNCTCFLSVPVLHVQLTRAEKEAGRRVMKSLLFPAAVEERDEQRGEEGVVISARHQLDLLGVCIEQKTCFKACHLVLAGAKLKVQRCF